MERPTIYTVEDVIKRMTLDKDHPLVPLYIPLHPKMIHHGLDTIEITQTPHASWAVQLEYVLKSDYFKTLSTVLQQRPECIISGLTMRMLYHFVVNEDTEKDLLGLHFAFKMFICAPTTSMSVPATTPERTAALVLDRENALPFIPSLIRVAEQIGIYVVEYPDEVADYDSDASDSYGREQIRWEMHRFNLNAGSTDKLREAITCLVEEHTSCADETHSLHGSNYGHNIILYVKLEIGLEDTLYYRGNNYDSFYSQSHLFSSVSK